MKVQYLLPFTQSAIIGRGAVAANVVYQHRLTITQPPKVMLGRITSYTKT